MNRSKRVLQPLDPFFFRFHLIPGKPSQVWELDKDTGSFLANPRREHKVFNRFCLGFLRSPARSSLCHGV